MLLLRKCNQGTRFLLCVVNIYSKYAWVVPLKDKKGIMITSTFQKISDKSDRKTNKLWVAQSSEFYNKSMKFWLQGKYIEIYLTPSNGKFVVAERFVRTMKKKIYKLMTVLSMCTSIG